MSANRRTHFNGVSITASIHKRVTLIKVVFSHFIISSRHCLKRSIQEVDSVPRFSSGSCCGDGATNGPTHDTAGHDCFAVGSCWSIEVKTAWTFLNGIKKSMEENIQPVIMGQR